MENVYTDKALQSYLGDISRYTVLSRDEEKEIILKAKSGDNLAKEKLIESNLKFVVKIASQYQNRGLSLLELISEGNIGLLIAIEKFDPDKDLKLISYAVWWIKAKILYSISKKADSEFGVRNSEFGIRRKYPYSLNKEIEDFYYEEIVEDDNNPQESFYKEKLYKSIREAIENLDEREAYIIKSYFGLYGYKEKTFSMIAETLGISKEYARRLKIKSMEKISKWINREQENEIYLVISN